MLGSFNKDGNLVRDGGEDERSALARVCGEAVREDAETFLFWIFSGFYARGIAQVAETPAGDLDGLGLGSPSSQPHPPSLNQQP